MTTSVFARRVWWSLIFLLCLTVVLLAIYVGVFGEVAQNWLQFQTLPLRTVYRAHKGAVDFTAVVIGAAVPAVTGGLAILKSFYYAEINLPIGLLAAIVFASVPILAARTRFTIMTVAAIVAVGLFLVFRSTI